MTATPISLPDLQRRLYVTAKAEKDWRFWGLYVHVAKLETLHAAYALAKQDNGAPGIDGVTFAAIEAAGAWRRFWRNCGANWSHAPTGHCGTDASRSRKTAARSASWGFRRFGTAWCKARSNSSWSAQPATAVIQPVKVRSRHPPEDAV